MPTALDLPRPSPRGRQEPGPSSPEVYTALIYSFAHFPKGSYLSSLPRPPPARDGLTGTWTKQSLQAAPQAQHVNPQPASQARARSHTHTHRVQDIPSLSPGPFPTASSPASPILKQQTRSPVPMFSSPAAPFPSSPQPQAKCPQGSHCVCFRLLAPIPLQAFLPVNLLKSF